VATIETAEAPPELTGRSGYVDHIHESSPRVQISFRIPGFDWRLAALSAMVVVMIGLLLMAALSSAEMVVF